VQTPQFAIDDLFGTFILFAFLFIGSLFLFPLLVMIAHTAAPNLFDAVPNPISGLFFFWRQLLLIPNGVRKGQTYIGHGTLVYFAAAFWFIVAFLYAGLTNRLGWPARLALVFPFIILVGVVVHILLGVVGLEVVLEGL